MTTRDDRDPGIEVRSDDVRVATDDLVITTAVRAARSASESPAEPAPVPDAPGRKRTRWLVAAVVVLVLAAVAGAVVLITRGGDTTTAARKSPADPAPGPTAALAAAVSAPTEVVAGQPAKFRVSYTDGSGIIAGSVEDWGDGVGASSVQQGSCAVSPPAVGPLAGSYTVRHVWSHRGTYTVKLGVMTYTCKSGKAVMDQAAKTLTVTVAAN